MDYKIVKKAENPHESTIQMNGKPIEFSLMTIASNIERANKSSTELEAQAKLNRAKMTNIEENHPFILQLTEMELFTAHMYFDAKAIATVSEQKLEEFKEAKVKDEAVLAELFEKMPEFKAEVDAFDAIVAGAEQKPVEEKAEDAAV